MGLRTRLLLLVLLPTVPALLLALGWNVEQRRLGAARVEKDAIRVVQLAAANQNGLLEATRQHLEGLSHLPQALGNDFPAYDRFFADLRRVFTDYTDFGLVETNGDLLASSFGTNGAASHAGFSYFQRVLKTREFAVGDYRPTHGRANPGLAFGCPVFRPNGDLARVIYASLDLNALCETLARAQISEGVVLEVFDHSGTVLARMPDAENWIGRPALESALFTAVRTKGEGTDELRGLDGEKRLYAFTALRHGQDIKLFVAVGIPTAQAYAETNQVLARDLFILAAVAALALIASRSYANKYVLAPVRALTETAQRLGAGDLNARAGIPRSSGELNQLATAFDQMAASLQQHGQEMERSKEALRQSESRVRQLNATLESRVAERTAQLATLNKELEAFCYSVSHDLRAPVRHINGFVNLLGQSLGAGLSAHAQQYLTIISSSANRMGLLIDDLLVFSRMGRLEMRQSCLSLSTLVDKAIEELEPETEGRNIVWKKGPLPEICADPAMLHQVLINLLANAVKYTRPRNPAEIEIGLARDREDEIVVFVRDNGVGFDMQYVNKLFGVFQRLHRDEDFEGTGIGLAIVRQIITRHGGCTWAEGNVGQGACFYFSLPKAARPAAV